MISIKIVKLGSQTTEFTLDDYATVSDLFEVSGENYVDGTVTRNHQVLTSESVLNDGDRIFIGTAVKGNQDIIDVNFVRLGGSTISLPAERGNTIAKVLEQLSQDERQKFYRPDGSVAYEFRVSGRGRPVDVDYVINPEGTVTSVRIICSQRVKGN